MYSGPPETRKLALNHYFAEGAGDGDGISGAAVGGTSRCLRAEDLPLLLRPRRKTETASPRYCASWNGYDGSCSRCGSAGVHSRYSWTGPPVRFAPEGQGPLVG